MKNMFRSILSISRPVLGLSLMVAAMATVASANAQIGVPEIDPGSIGSALTLLASGALLVSGKARKA